MVEDAGQRRRVEVLEGRVSRCGGQALGDSSIDRGGSVDRTSFATYLYATGVCGSGSGKGRPTQGRRRGRCCGAAGEQQSRESGWWVVGAMGAREGDGREGGGERVRGWREEREETEWVRAGMRSVAAGLEGVGKGWTRSQRVGRVGRRRMGCMGCMGGAPKRVRAAACGAPWAEPGSSSAAAASLSTSAKPRSNACALPASRDTPPLRRALPPPGASHPLPPAWRAGVGRKQATIFMGCRPDRAQPCVAAKPHASSPRRLVASHRSSLPDSHRSLAPRPVRRLHVR